MNNSKLMFSFIKTIQDRKLLTKFLKNIFDYQELHDYNYIFRITDDNNIVILDIYDNVSDNRFNRYIFNFKDINNGVRITEDGNVFVTNIPTKIVSDSDIKLYKLAYLFKLEKSKMIDYGKTFLDSEFITILMEIIK